MFRPLQNKLLDDKVVQTKAARGLSLFALLIKNASSKLAGRHLVVCRA
jgi:hypothetical protein